MYPLPPPPIHLFLCKATFLNSQHCCRFAFTGSDKGDEPVESCEWSSLYTAFSLVHFSPSLILRLTNNCVCVCVPQQPNRRRCATPAAWRRRGPWCSSTWAAPTVWGASTTRRASAFIRYERRCWFSARGETGTSIPGWSHLWFMLCLCFSSPSKAALMVNTKEIPPEAILLGVYLELQNGERPLTLVSKCFSFILFFMLFLDPLRPSYQVTPSWRCRSSRGTSSCQRRCRRPPQTHGRSRPKCSSLPSRSSPSRPPPPPPAPPLPPPPSHKCNANKSHPPPFHTCPLLRTTNWQTPHVAQCAPPPILWKYYL